MCVYVIADIICSVVQADALHPGVSKRNLLPLHEQIHVRALI